MVRLYGLVVRALAWRSEGRGFKSRWPKYLKIKSTNCLESVSSTDEPCSGETVSGLVKEEFLGSPLLRCGWGAGDSGQSIPLAPLH
jgi:hypothetical protein